MVSILVSRVGSIVLYKLMVFRVDWFSFLFSMFFRTEFLDQPASWAE